MRAYPALASVLAVILSAGASLAQMPTTSNDPAAKKELEGYQRSYETAKKKYHASPKPANKKALVIATVRYATASMTTSVLIPHVRYPQALRLYREALKLDPTNNEAKSNSDLIISIYKQMHRAIPKG